MFVDDSNKKYAYNARKDFDLFKHDNTVVNSKLHKLLSIIAISLSRNCAIIIYCQNSRKFFFITEKALKIY